MFSLESIEVETCYIVGKSEEDSVS